MGKTRNAREKRMQSVAKDALATEIKKNNEKISSIVPDSALFAADEDIKKRKKIILHPRPDIEANPKPEKVKYTDIWSEDIKTDKFVASKTGRKNKQPLKPTSEESYTNKSLVKPKKAEDTSNDQPAVFDPADEQVEYDDGIVDTLVEEVEELPENPEIEAPAPAPKKEFKNAKLHGHIPKFLPADIKKELRKINKEGHRQLAKADEEKLLPEFERAKEVAEEIERRKQEEASKPPKPAANPLERFIVDAPELRVDEPAKSLSDLQPDQHPFVRMQRDLEINRKVGLHN